MTQSKQLAGTLHDAIKTTCRYIAWRNQNKHCMTQSKQLAGTHDTRSIIKSLREGVKKYWLVADWSVNFFGGSFPCPHQGHHGSNPPTVVGTKDTPWRRTGRSSSNPPSVVGTKDTPWSMTGRSSSNPPSVVGTKDTPLSSLGCYGSNLPSGVGTKVTGQEGLVLKHPLL